MKKTKWRDTKLSKEEQEIEDLIDEHAPLKLVSKEESDATQAAIAVALAARRKDAVLNIRLNSMDLKRLKEKAQKLGVKYQTFISEILHRAAH